MFSAILGSWRLLTIRQRLAFGAISVSRILANILDIVGIALIALIVSVSTGTSLVLPILGEIDFASGQSIQILLAITAAVFFAKTIISMTLSRFTFLFLARLETAASMKIVDSVFGGSLESAMEYSKHELDWIVLRSTHITFNTILGQAAGFFAEATLGLVVLLTFFWVDWVSSIAIMLFFSAILIFFQLATRAKMAVSGANVADGSISVHQAISDFYAAYREIAVSRKREFFTERIRKSRSAVATAQSTEGYMNSLPRIIVEIGLITGAIGFFMMEYIRSEGLPDLAVLAIFLIGSLRIMSALLPIQRAFMTIRFLAPQAISAQDVIRKSLSDSPPLRTTSKLPSGIQLERGVVIEAKELTFKYSDSASELATLTRISMKVEAGSFAAIIGPSGAGKSTLVDIILGLLTPSSGEVLHDGGPPGLFRRGVSDKISYVPQRPGIVSGNIRDNIALGVAPGLVDEKLVWEALDAAEVGDFVRGLPSGLDSSLGQNQDSLSGGQMQRLGVARALYTRPRLLILDEATSALDPETESAISRSLLGLLGGTTIIVVAHRLSTIQRADNIFVLENGSIAASGNFRELQKNSDLVKNYINLMTLD